MSILRVKSILFIGIAWSLSTLAQGSDFPEWLGGKPDLDIRSDRCGVYEWFFNQADSQTEGVASTNELASKRVINVANKLIDHHLLDPEGSYGAEIIFLVIDADKGPFDFEFHLSNEKLEGIINKSCGN